MKMIKETVAVTVLVEIEHEGRQSSRDEAIRVASRHLTRHGGTGCDWWSHGFHVDHGVIYVGRSAVAAVRRTKARITRRGKVRS